MKINGTRIDPLVARVIFEQLTREHAGGKHNQKSHGYRFGSAPKPSRARQMKKDGTWDDYKKRAGDRGRVGAKAKNAAKPKPKPKKKKGPPEVTAKLGSREHVDQTVQKLAHGKKVGRYPKPKNGEKSGVPAFDMNDDDNFQAALWNTTELPKKKNDYHQRLYNQLDPNEKRELGRSLNSFAIGVTDRTQSARSAGRDSAEWNDFSNRHLVEWGFAARRQGGPTRDLNRALWGRFKPGDLD